MLNPNDPNGDTGYKVMTVEEFTSQLNVNSLTILKVFINVVIGVASIVGFIVVFMAMYTAVLERTREIGILKAVGAGPGYILNILFRETILLALLGTVFGILLTYGTKWIMLQAVPASLTQDDRLQVVAHRRSHRHRRRHHRHRRPRLPRRQAGRHRGPQL